MLIKTFIDADIILLQLVLIAVAICFNVKFCLMSVVICRDLLQWYIIVISAKKRLMQKQIRFVGLINYWNNNCCLDIEMFHL